MSEFREAVLDALDRFYEHNDGQTPDHIILSEDVVAILVANDAFWSTFPQAKDFYGGRP